ncbi:hypothetical protein PHYPSEUDO_013747 [Phytophthora pseudosyringae]|uniref:Uncharacterized protein n=1 Tax=Phytophthora pseudosyringae TaxID=221518 RepID=A0A8T1W1J2_9STRA|nr:hypothetical protein PHYPSEUDO_013747 [Phytophthora pseudosyringae]
MTLNRVEREVVPFADGFDGQGVRGVADGRPTHGASPTLPHTPAFVPEVDTVAEARGTPEHDTVAAQRFAGPPRSLGDRKRWWRRKPRRVHSGPTTVVVEQASLAQDCLLNPVLENARPNNRAQQAGPALQESRAAVPSSGRARRNPRAPVAQQPPPGSCKDAIHLYFAAFAHGRQPMLYWSLATVLSNRHGSNAQNEEGDGAQEARAPLEQQHNAASGLSEREEAEVAEGPQVCGRHDQRLAHCDAAWAKCRTCNNSSVGAGAVAVPLEWILSVRLQLALVIKCELWRAWVPKTETPGW